MSFCSHLCTGVLKGTLTEVKGAWWHLPRHCGHQPPNTLEAHYWLLCMPISKKQTFQRRWQWTAGELGRQGMLLSLGKGSKYLGLDGSGEGEEVALWF